jgi:hypothetical protein
MRRGVGLLVTAIVAVLLCAGVAGARVASAHRTVHKRHVVSPSVDLSLYHGSGPKPGPAILYEPTAVAPQLQNTGIWHAQPILISGAEAYRDGEFLYQDYLYDDHGAHLTADPNDPQSADLADLFSMPNGTYTYPTGAGYNGNAADLVEFRVKPTATATAFRVTMNTMVNPLLMAFSVAIGGTAGKTYAFPDGANVVAPASLFLTVHASGSKLIGQLVHAGSDTPVAGPAPVVSVDTYRRQIQVLIPHAEWNPRRGTVRLAAGFGLWDASSGSYLLPQTSASATAPGGAGVTTNPAAFFNVAFRTSEPMPSVEDSTNAVLDAAWWRDRAQAQALAAGNISPFYAQVNFAKLWKKVTDNSMVPRTGPMDMILPSHFEPAQGVNFSKQCGLTGASNPATCVPEYNGRLEPFAIYVPAARPPASGYGLTLLLHSLSANYNQFMSSRNQSQFANRSVPSIVITPEARGPDQEYQGLGAADVFEVWAMVSRLYHLNPAYTDIAGYSMGGIGTFKLASQFPDLFARAQPTVGFESNNDVLASLRNVPVLMWNNSADELVNVSDYTKSADALANDGYRYELDVYRPCASPLCSPLFPDHLELAVNDEFAPAAAFLGSALVNYNPAHVTYVVDQARNYAQYGVVGNHAYWVSGLTLRSLSHTASNGDPEGSFDAVSHGFGVGDPVASALKVGTGSLTGGYMGPIQYASFTKTWGPVPAAPRADSIDITATNIATATIDPARADVNCKVALHITSDGPISVVVAGCHRTVTGG